MKKFIDPKTYTVLAHVNKSQGAAKTRQILKDSSYGVPEMVKELEHFIGAVGNGVGTAYRDMNNYQKGLFLLAILGIGGYALDNTLNESKVSKGAAKYAEKGVDLGKAKVGDASKYLQDVYKGLTTKAPVAITTANSVQKQLADAGIGAGVFVGENASAINTTEKVNNTPSYAYNAKEGNPDPSIKFIDGEGDTEFEEILNWHMADLRMRSAYDVEEFEKYLVFRPGKDPTPRDVDFTKDGREIFYVDNYPALYEILSKKALKRDMENGRPARALYDIAAHEKGHRKTADFVRSNCASGDSKCVEISAITEQVDANIRAYFTRETDREEHIKNTWEGWKVQHNYTEK